MNSACAVIYGATGAVGGELLKLCLEDPNYQRVLVLARKDATLEHEKLIWRTSAPDQLADQLGAHTKVDAYCCIGTTLNQAGSREAFRSVDYDLVLSFAKCCRTLEVAHFCAVSALGANPDSNNYYSRTKGQM